MTQCFTSNLYTFYEPIFCYNNRIFRWSWTCSDWTNTRIFWSIFSCGEKFEGPSTEQFGFEESFQVSWRLKVDSSQNICQHCYCDLKKLTSWGKNVLFLIFFRPATGSWWEIDGGKLDWDCDWSKAIPHRAWPRGGEQQRGGEPQQSSRPGRQTSVRRVETRTGTCPENKTSITTLGLSWTST